MIFEDWMRRRTQNWGGKASASLPILMRAWSFKRQSIGTYYCDITHISGSDCKDWSVGEAVAVPE
eukprot:4497041-Pleurochrysis_carterae.AAC.1